MWRFLCLCAASIMMPLSAQADGLYLECGDYWTTKRAVSLLTLAQLRSPDYTVRYTRGLPRACRSTNLTSNGFVYGSWPAMTRDGWQVRIIDWEQSNGWEFHFVDATRAYFRGVQQHDYRYKYRPRQRHSVPQVQRPKKDLTIKEGQQWLKQELQRLLE